MLHRFKIEPIGDSGIYEKVFIDDMKIRCSGYSLEHKVGELPTVTVDITVIPRVDSSVNFKIGNLAEIAEIMDLETFLQFKEIWEEVHK